jgi:WS/DGAT/MGAT family acyltransferase
VQLTAVAAPGEHQDLLDICAELYTEPLDRSVPLWELWLIDGLADGRVGIVEKIHHALIDGISGVELAAAIFDGQADPPAEPTEDPGAPSVPDPPAAQRAADAVREQVVDPVQTAGRVGSTMLTSPGQVVEQISSIVASIRDVARIGAKAPETSFNHPIGRRRALRAVPLDLDVVHRARAPHQATVNDLVLTTIAGALRHWMIDSGEPLVDVHVFAPMSTRHDAMGAEPGNRVGGMLVELPVGEDDPIWRLELVKSRMARLKQQHEGESVAAVFDALDHLPAIGYAAVLRVLSGQPLINVVVTNLPGPRDPLFFLGDRIEQMIPVVPLGLDMGLGIAVLSYLDRLTVTLFADPDVCHDLDLLADCVAGEFDVLVAALEADATS